MLIACSLEEKRTLTIPRSLTCNPVFGRGVKKRKGLTATGVIYNGLRLQGDTHHLFYQKNELQLESYNSWKFIMGEWLVNVQ